jgi:hypothetical protein
MSDLVLSAPGIFQALYNLINEAAAGLNPSVPAFPFALNQAEPPAYVLVRSIENHRIKWVGIGLFQQEETYDITGIATVFSGSATPDDLTVTTDVMDQTFSLFQSAVMTPVMTNRQTTPLLGTTGPSPNWVLPGFASYSAAPAEIGGAPGGWAGVIEWSFSFSALLTPA